MDCAIGILATDLEKLKIDLFEKFNSFLLKMEKVEQQYVEDKENSQYKEEYVKVSEEYDNIVNILNKFDLWNEALHYCVDQGTLTLDVFEDDKEKEIEELTKIIESTFDYAKKYYPDKYEPFELNVYPDEIARTIIENGYKKVEE
jgi:protein subunit release factor A